MTDCNVMNTVVSDVLICKDNSDLTESLSRNKLQESKNEVEGEQSHLSCSVEASVCDNLVDLNSYTDETQPTHIKQDPIVLNPDLEGLVFPTFSTASEVFSSLPQVSTTMTINLEPHNNCPFILGKIDNISASFLCDTGAAITAISSTFYKQVPNLTKHPPDKLAVQSIKTVNGEIVPVQGLALIPFQIGESIYPFHAYIVKNLAYDVILGADFLTYHNSTINFDCNTIELPPPTDTPPPCPTPAFSCSVHASLTCILPPFSESILPAVLNESLLTPPTTSRVGLVESNPSLAERYSLLGAAALVTISDTNTIPFRVINPTSQPVTIFRRTNPGHISLYQQPPAVSVIDTNQTETSSTRRTLYKQTATNNDKLTILCFHCSDLLTKIVGCSRFLFSMRLFVHSTNNLARFFFPFSAGLTHGSYDIVAIMV